jgi:membrane protease YdiL (CAAX protease family)
MRFQWLVFALFMLALVVDHRVLWPSFVRRVAREPDRARQRLWLQWMTMLWFCTILVLGLWIARDRPLADLGLGMPSGWRLWAPIFLIVAFVWLQLASATRMGHRKGDNAKLRRQLGTTGLILPHKTSELPAWVGMSLSAGFCEELLFRGFVIWLLQPVLGTWLAALTSLALFAAAHAYQGLGGLSRSALLGAALTAVVLVTGSLWPAIALHAVIDGMGGWIGWVILRDRPMPALPLRDEQRLQGPDAA